MVERGVANAEVAGSIPVLRMTEKRCRAKNHGQRCELARRHRGYHRVTVSPTKTIMWADLLRLLMWS